MKPRVTLLVVYGDGWRVTRVSLPRWIAYGILGVGGAAVATMVGLSGRYALLLHQSTEIAALRQRAEDQRAIIETFRTRVAGVSREIMGWKALHAKMWEAFGPEAGSTAKGAGVGGAAPADAAPAAGINVRPSEELDRLVLGVAEEGPRLRELEHVVSRTGKLMSALPLRWPVRGPVKSEFGPRRSPWSGAPEQHEGIDIGSPPGTPVNSPSAGTVVTASTHGDLGQHVMVDHGHGVRSLYGHLRRIDVKAGQRVEKGQVIGLVGNTGRSTGPHLHYELLVQGKPVDPRGFLWEH